MPGPPSRIPNQAAKVTYATAISNATGLSLAAVLAWVTGENGPGNNFLGVKDPTTGTIGPYATPEAGAAAAISVLRQPNMAAILTTAKATNDPKVELAAIASSPWDTGKAGPKPGYLQLLLGALTSNSNNPALALVPGSGDTAPPLNIPNIPNPLTAWVGDLTGWLQKESAVALAYFVLTMLGLAFVVFGALDTFGYSPARVAGGLKPSSPVPDPIPF